MEATQNNKTNTQKLLDEIAKQLQSFQPFVIYSENKLIVLDHAKGEWDQLDEMQECCGVDAELWYKDQGYFVLEHPEV